MSKYGDCIKEGELKPLEEVPFHAAAPLTRFLMIDKDLFPSSNIRVAVHIIGNLPKVISDYAKMHKHDFDEINLILSENGILSYNIVLGDEEYIVSSPATIYIPKGVAHKALVKSGKGTFVCITLDGKYSATK